jgi:hypothetical protein
MTKIVMDADEIDDALDLRDPKIKSQIRQSNKDIRAGRTKPAEYTSNTQAIAAHESPRTT